MARDNEDNALKAFYAKEGEKHIEFKLGKAALFLDKDRAYIGASHDAIMHYKCHEESILKVKCQYNILNSFIKEDINRSSFLSTNNAQGTINEGNKCYIQVISQIKLSKSNQ